MSKLNTVQSLLTKAESAATAGDLAAADELLREAARIQEDELGAIHPDLANTFNNRAIIAEKTGRPDEAETFYRRAVAIATASLPADDPMLAASRQNLEEFCRAQGRPIDPPAVAAPAAAAAIVAAPVVPVEPPSQESIPLPPASPSVPVRDRRPASSTAVVAMGAILLVTAALFFMWPRPSAENAAARRSQPSAPATEPARQAAAVERAQPPPPVPIVPAEPSQPPPASRGNARSQGTVTLADVELCRTFSPRGENWKCEPAGATVGPGQLALYTRVKSPRDGVVVHRWYRGDELRQAVRLEVRASATEGYRTYSRQTVHAGEAWRAEVRSPSGDLLHEQRVTVR